MMRKTPMDQVDRGIQRILMSEIAPWRVQWAFDTGSGIIVPSFPLCKANLKLTAGRARKENLGKVRVMDINEVLVKSIAK